MNHLFPTHVFDVGPKLDFLLTRYFHLIKVELRVYVFLLSNRVDLSCLTLTHRILSFGKNDRQFVITALVYLQELILKRTEAPFSALFKPIMWLYLL